MKYLKLILIIFLAGTFKMINVFALSCPSSISKDLAQEASYVKVSYEIIDNSEEKELTVEENKTVYKIPKYNFVFTIYNLTENIYIKIKEDVNSQNKNIYLGDTLGGTYAFTNSDAGQIYNYTFTIHSNNENCKDQLIRTIRVTKPKYNAYSEFAYCINSSNYYCQRFVEKDLKLKTTDDFLEAISANVKEDISTNKEQSNSTIPQKQNTNWVIFALIGICLLLISTVVTIFVKKAKDKKRWEV